MVFSSLSFLYAFLPIVIISYFLFKSRVYRNTVLMIASLLFYSWGEPQYIIIMLLSVLIAYLGGLGMYRYPKTKKALLIISTVLLVGNLFVFKYLNFFAGVFCSLFGIENGLRHIALPIGISFFTFQILSYVIDLYRGEIEVQRNYFYLLLYVSFFPQLIAGPIVRYQTVEQEITNRSENLEDVFLGAVRFAVGLAKKLIIANNVALVAEMIYSGADDIYIYGTTMYWIAAIAYTLQIYFDFSGYSDMAIGLGRIFGFHFLENFNYPYLAVSVTDFWRRWHISLSSWFRDYVYIPLGGNRVSRYRWIFNILVVWALTGFWHGAQWNFLLWGLYYGVLLIVEKLFLAKGLEKLPVFIRRFYALFIVIVGWVIFNNTEMDRLVYSLVHMFTFVPTDWEMIAVNNIALIKVMPFVLLGIAACLPCWKRLVVGVYEKYRVVGTILLSAIFVGFLVICNIFLVSTTFNPFIYFRF